MNNGGVGNCTIKQYPKGNRNLGNGMRCEDSNPISNYIMD